MSLKDNRDFKIRRRDGNQNVKRKNEQTNKTKQKSKQTIGLARKNKNFARASHFFVHFSAVFARLYDVKLPNFTFYGGRKQATTK